MRHLFALAFIFIGFTSPILAQNATLIPPLQGKSNLGKFYVFWGYNRSMYTTSDISVKGRGYDFTAYDVKADDDPESFDPNIYLNILKLTIPQFNFRAGYYISERASISMGWDHLKYRLNHQQTVNVDGDYVKNGETIHYDQEPIFLTNRFFHLEHTDGLNYVRINYDYSLPLIATQNKKISLDAIVGAGLGPVLPWTDAVLDGEQFRAFLRPAGAGISTNLSVRLNIGGSFFLQSTGRVGAIKLIDVYISEEIRGKQQFAFAEFNIVAGFTFGLKKVK
jgi:hypothetical protein